MFVLNFQLWRLEIGKCDALVDNFYFSGASHLVEKFLVHFCYVNYFQILSQDFSRGAFIVKLHNCMFVAIFGWTLVEIKLCTTMLPVQKVDLLDERIELELQQ